MTDHEPSYYEIALTNRQVVVAFVILLACLMGTFFAGVWVGGGDAPQAAAEVPAAGEQAVADEQPIEELDFFGGGGEVAPPQGDRTEVRYEEPGPGEGGSEPPREDPAVQRNRREARAAAARAAREDAADTAGGEGAALSQDAPTAQPQQQADTRTETMEPIRETAPPTTTRPQPRQDSSGDLVVHRAGRENSAKTTEDSRTLDSRTRPAPSDAVASPATARRHTGRPRTAKAAWKAAR